VITHEYDLMQKIGLKKKDENEYSSIIEDNLIK
jgi:hypothetical protein